MLEVEALASELLASKLLKVMVLERVPEDEHVSIAALLVDMA